MILSLVGLFDRPAEPDALAAVLAAPPIPGLTDGWHALSDLQRKLRWDFALKRLRALKLIASADATSSPPLARTATPLSRRQTQRAACSTPTPSCASTSAAA